MTAAVMAARPTLGYQVIPDRTGRPVGVRSMPRGGHLGDETPLAAIAGRRLVPGLAVVLGAQVPPAASPGAAALAVAGICVVVTVTDGNDAVVALWVGEHLLDPAVDGPVTLTGGGAVSVTFPTDPADRVPQVQWLASTLGGLEAGTVVLTAARTAGLALSAAPGPWEAGFAGAGTLSVRVLP